MRHCRSRHIEPPHSPWRSARALGELLPWLFREGIHHNAESYKEIEKNVVGRKPCFDCWSQVAGHCSESWPSRICDSACMRRFPVRRLSGQNRIFWDHFRLAGHSPRTHRGPLITRLIRLFCWRSRWIQINHEGYPQTCEPSQKVKIKGDSALPFSEENSQKRVTFHSMSTGLPEAEGVGQQ